MLLLSVQCQSLKEDEKAWSCVITRYVSKNTVLDQLRKIFLRDISRCFNCLRVRDISKNCIQSSLCYSCESKHHVPFFEKKTKSHRNLISSCKYPCNCSFVKLNTENNSATDYTAGQANSRNKFKNSSVTMINKSEISNLTNINEISDLTYVKETRRRVTRSIK